MKKVGILNGPNLNYLGKREPEIYGTRTLQDLEVWLNAASVDLGLELHFFQANSEGALIDKIYSWVQQGVKGIVLNPAAYSHTSIALLDALKGCGLPVIEVHLSNLYRRDAMRAHSVTASGCIGVISGLGFQGYSLALNYFSKSLSE